MDDTNFGFFNRIFSELDSKLEIFITDTIGDIITSFSPVTVQLVTLYFIVYGLMIMRGMADEPITEFAYRVVRLSIIIGIALNVSYYSESVVNFIWDFPNALASVLTQGSSEEGAASHLDSLISQVYSLGSAFWVKGSAPTIPHLGLILCAIAVWAVGLALTAYAAFLLCLAKFMLSILLALGPIFILLLIFSPTKRFFESWLGQALNYGFLVVLSSSCIKLVMAVLEMYISESGASIKLDPQVSDIIPAAAICVIGGLLLMQVNGVAASLGGGVAVSTLGAAGFLYNKMKGGLVGSKNIATGKTLSDMRSARRQKENNARWANQNPGTAARISGMPISTFRKLTTPRFNHISKR